MKKRRMIMMLAVVAMTMGLMAPASAGGLTADKLDDAGWSCVPAGPHGWVHCFSPAAEASAGSITIRVMVFDVPGDTFLGPELLIHEDVYNQQPCMTDGGAEYTYLEPLIGAPYYACHR